MGDLTQLHSVPLWQTACRLSKIFFDLGQNAVYECDLFQREYIQGAALRLTTLVAEAYDADVAEGRARLVRAEQAAGELRHYLALAERYDFLTPDTAQEARRLFAELTGEIASWSGAAMRRAGSA